MIQLKDSFKFAKAKIKTRKLRNLFSGCTISLGIIIILVVLMGTAGVLNLGKKVFKDSNDGRFFAILNTYGNPNGSEVDYLSVDGDGNRTGVDVAKFKKENEKYNIKNVFVSRMFTSSFSLQGVSMKYPGMAGNESDEMGTGIVSSDDVFVKDMLLNDYTFEDKYGNAIPIIMPKNFLVNSLTDKATLNSKESYELSQKVVDTYLGKKYFLNQISYGSPEDKKDMLDPYTPPKQTITKLDTQVIIVGFSDSGFFNTNPISSYNIVIPNWAVEKDKTFKEMATRQASFTVIPEFSTKKDRNAYVKASQFMASPILGKLEAFEEIIATIRKVALGIGGFFLLISALFILTTLGKIVADSKKEIGVFRAVGAQRADIKKIFFSYAFILTTIGFVMGFIISVIFNTVLSLVWGDDLFYTIADMGAAPGLKQPLLLFVGTPFLYIGLLYIFILLVGLTASYFPARKASKVDPILALREG